LSRQEYRVWAEAQPRGRFERVEGEVVAMAPERLGHVLAKRRAADALDAAIKRGGVACEAFVDGLAVAVDKETSYVPDALVCCGEEFDTGSMIAPNPVIVVEVLSPSTRSLDKTTKLADYFRVPGLSHYLIVDLSRRHVVHNRKQPDGVVTVAIVEDGEMALDPPGISVAAASFFD